MVFAFLLLVASIVGCVLPVLPGPPLAYAGILLLHLTDKVHFTTQQLIVWLVVVVVLQVVDYITPLLGSKYSGGTSFGNRGSIAGTIIGMFFMPWGLIIGPFVGAFIGEMIGRKIEPKQALKVGIGAMLAFIAGTGIKLIAGAYMFIFVIKDFIAYIS